MEAKEWLTHQIEQYVAKSEGRSAGDGTPYFETPLVGVADFSDPLFRNYKEIIGDFHYTPKELLETCFPGQEFSAGSVIVWVLPIHSRTRLSNRREAVRPSREWCQTRQFGEAFNVGLRRQVVGWLEELGAKAVAPQLSEHWAEIKSPLVGAASRWSERHAAYAAGLGTFSLNDGLITAKGMAHRLGSVVTDLEFPADPRPWPNHLHNCLYYRNGSCGVCIRRCPVGALSWAGHDKARCMEFVYGTLVQELGQRYGVKTTGCGLCQTAVPCEERIPG